MICKKRHRIKVLLKKYTQGTQELDIQIMIMLQKKIAVEITKSHQSLDSSSWRYFC